MLALALALRYTETNFSGREAPMTFREACETLHAKVFHPSPDFESRTFYRVVACDLMSDVLVTEAEDFLLVTSLPSEQAARTADMTGACGIVLVNGKNPQPGLLKLAEELGLTLLSTPKSCFEACVALGKALGA